MLTNCEILVLINAIRVKKIKKIKAEKVEIA